MKTTDGWKNGKFTKHKLYGGPLLPQCIKHGNLEVEAEKGEC